MPAQLVALTEGPNILLDKPILLFGRHPECDVQIDSRKISRRHCCIAQVNNYLVVRDLGSTNGIRINGVRVLEGRLTVGDELTIGSHRYQVAWESLQGQGASGRPSSKEPGRQPRPRTAINDDLLESAEEPVPLGEPENPHRPPLPKSPEASPLPDPKRKPELILPDHIELAPASDSFNGMSSHSSHP
jgi:pSer/pThr/pTyr-binding forkhead associated (FHA) protein